MRDVTPEHIRGTRWMILAEDRDQSLHAVNLHESFRRQIPEHWLYMPHKTLYMWLQDLLSEKLEESPDCNHEFVNVSFMQIKMVCRHCNQEQP